MVIWSGKVGFLLGGGADIFFPPQDPKMALQRIQAAENLLPPRGGTEEVMAMGAA